MISEKELQEAIADCHGVRNPNANTCLKLAAYYIIQDHLNEEPTYSYAAKPPERIITYNSSSEFSDAIKNKKIDEILPIIDELMETLSVVNPRLYNGVLTRLSY